MSRGNFGNWGWGGLNYTFRLQATQLMISPLLPTRPHWMPLFSTGRHWMPLFSTGPHWMPLFSTGRHWIPLFSTGRHYPTSFIYRVVWLFLHFPSPGHTTHDFSTFPHSLKSRLCGFFSNFLFQATQLFISSTPKKSCGWLKLHFSSPGHTVPKISLVTHLLKEVSEREGIKFGWLNLYFLHLSHPHIFLPLLKKKFPVA